VTLFVAHTARRARARRPPGSGCPFPRDRGQLAESPLRPLPNEPRKFGAGAPRIAGLSAAGLLEDRPYTHRCEQTIGRVTGWSNQTKGSLGVIRRCERAVRHYNKPPASSPLSWPLSVTLPVDDVCRPTMDAPSHPADCAVLRAHRSGTAAAAAMVLVGTFAAAASAAGAAVSASTPATFDLAAALYRHAGSDPAGAGPPGSRDLTSFCSGPVSITATCPCYWKVGVVGDAPGLSLDATLVLAKRQPAGTTEAALKAAAATLSRVSVSKAKIVPAPGTQESFLFESRTTIIKDAVTVVATAALRGGTGADNMGRCLTYLLMPFRKVEATCPKLDISYGNTGGRPVRTLSRAAASVTPPAAMDDFLTEEEVLDQRQPAAMRDGNAAVAPVSRSFDRVVGGTPLTDPDTRRWVVKLYKSDGGRYRFACTGSVIGRRHVLTAAHCRMTAGTIVAFLPPPGRGTPLVEVVAATNHPAYADATNENDVAVLRLGSDAPGWPRVNSTELPPVIINRSPMVPLDGSGVRSSGYGVITEGYSLGSGVARSVDTRVVAPAKCEAIYGRIQASTARQLSDGHSPALMICSGVPKGDCDTCQGDSGGPLYQRATVGLPGGVLANLSVIVGVTSWGVGCARPGVPGVYARVSAYADWIITIVSA